MFRDFKLCPTQIEQQDQVVNQLQQELHSERNRHQETSRQHQVAKKTTQELQEEVDKLQRKQHDSNQTVSIGLKLKQHKSNHEYCITCVKNMMLLIIQYQNTRPKQ